MSKVYKAHLLAGLARKLFYLGLQSCAAKESVSLLYWGFVLLVQHNCPLHSLEPGMILDVPNATREAANTFAQVGLCREASLECTSYYRRQDPDLNKEKHTK